MPSHKVLKSIAHNFGDSFISMMNFRVTDYVLGHIQKQMQLTGKHKLTVDILHNTAEPSELLSPYIQGSISDHCAWFPRLVSSCNSSPEFIKSAVMTIRFDFTRTRPWHYDPSRTENPFECAVTIVDERGKAHKALLQGWWFAES